MIVEALLAVLALVGYLFYRHQRGSRYWNGRGVPVPAAESFPFGTHPLTKSEVVTRKINTADSILKQYKEFKAQKFYGVYGAVLAPPILVVKDLDLAEHILGIGYTYTHIFFYGT